jgi:hypothetical protein
MAKATTAFTSIISMTTGAPQVSLDLESNRLVLRDRAYQLLLHPGSGVFKQRAA